MIGEKQKTSTQFGKTSTSKYLMLEPVSLDLNN